MRYYTLVFLLLHTIVLVAQKVPVSASIQFFSEFNYYTSETGTLVFCKTKGLEKGNYECGIKWQGKIVSRTSINEFGEAQMYLGLHLFGAGNSQAEVYVQKDEKQIWQGKLSISKYPPQKNAVRIHLPSGSLYQDSLPLFPLGFYTYWPVQSDLLEHEVVRGFNLVSPYQNPMRSKLEERIKYMDRCAELGMKVNYQLIALAGGGGIGSKTDLSPSARMQLLEAEIKAFRNHPALLSWYIADEPVHRGIQPADLAPAYQLIKKLDPYHPVSIVFLRAEGSGAYEQVLDIAMVDPYPIPRKPIALVREETKKLSEIFKYKKAIWVVPQAFGGNEWWEREPTPAEARAMTWMAVLEGARGLQYFIRHHGMSFPKNPAMWAECALQAQRIQSLQPWLNQELQHKYSTSLNKTLLIKTYFWNYQYVTIVLNMSSEPQSFDMSIPMDAGESVEVLWEGRSRAVVKGVIKDLIPSYGVQIYQWSQTRVPASIWNIVEKNLIRDPSFEQSEAAGIPAACYLRAAQDKGATCSLDPRNRVHGNYSLKIHTPIAEKGLKVSFFPIALETNQSYTLSVWAKGTRKGQKGKLIAGELGNFPLTLEEYWKRFSFVIKTEPKHQQLNKVLLHLVLEDSGTAWFDLIQLHPGKTSPAPDVANDPELLVARGPATEKIPENVGYFTMHTGGMGEPSFPAFESNPDAKLSTPESDTSLVFPETDELGEGETIKPSYSWEIQMLSPVAKEYPGNGFYSLVDGKTASLEVSDKLWVGWQNREASMLFIRDSTVKINAVQIGLLQQPSHGIYYPGKIEIYRSRNGQEYELLKKTILPANTRKNTVTSRMDLIIDVEPVNARYLKLVLVPHKKSFKTAKKKELLPYLLADEVQIR